MTRKILEHDDSGFAQIHALYFCFVAQFIRKVRQTVSDRALAALAAGLMLAAGSASAETWIKAQSEHFTLYSNTSEGKTRTYIKALEQFRALTILLLGSSDTVAQPRFTLYVLKDQDQIRLVRPAFARQVAGIYFNCAEGDSAYSSVQTSGDVFDDQDPSLIVLFHEYSHFVMFQHARTYYPPWYVEGFAEYLSTADPMKDKISIGEDNKWRSWTLAEDRQIPYARVLKPSFGFAGDKSNNAWEVESFYAQSWLLTHYMLSDTKRTKAVNAYFAEVARGADPVKSFEDTTGIKVSSLHDTLERYGRSMVYLNVPVPSYPDASITVARVAPNVGGYLLDRSLLTTCMQADQGKAVLARLQTQSAALPDDWDLKLAVARAQLLYDKAEAADATIGPVIDAHPESFEANYLIGRIYLKEAESASDKDRIALTDAARGFFITAYKLDKSNAANLYYLARSFQSEPGFPDTNAVNAANAAHIMAPSIAEYAIFDAFVNLSIGKRDEAVVMLTPYAGDPHNRAQAERMQKAIDAIKAGKTAGEIMRMMGGG